MRLVDVDRSDAGLAVGRLGEECEVVLPVQGEAEDVTDLLGVVDDDDPDRRGGVCLGDGSYLAP